MSARHARVSMIGCALAAASAALPAPAQHHVEYGLNLSLGFQYIEQYAQGAEPSGPIEREAVQEGYGRVAGIANVGFGVNKARVDLTGTNPDDPFTFEYGFASSRYFDVMQFDDPKLNGTHGFFDVTLYVEGEGFVELSDNILNSPDTEFDAFWHAVINVMVDGVETPTGPVQSALYAGEWYKGFNSSTLEYFGDPLNTYQQTVTMEFIYGQPILMDTFLQVLTQIDNQWAIVPGTLDTTIDLGNSTYWGGIRNLRDANGQPVTTASYSSSSGFDYREAALPGVLTGDLNCDGAVSVSDIGGFVLALTDPAAYAAQYPACEIAAADANSDGQTTVSDIGPFVALLTTR